MDKLLNVADIVNKYNVSRHQVWNWIRRDNSFPKPKQYVSNDSMPLFSDREVDCFIKSREKKALD